MENRMSRKRYYLRIDLINAIVIVLFLLTTRTESMERNTETETAPTVCILSGKVVDFDTGKPARQVGENA